MYYQTFSLVAHSLTPLLIYIIMGYIGGKVIKIEKDSIANFLFYLVNPIAFFYNISKTEISGSLIAVPFIFFITGCIICVSFYFIGKKIWSDDTANLLALSSGTGNIGYIMLPLIYVFFGAKYLPMFFLIVIGISLYENTLGFYMSAAGSYTAKDSLIKLLKLPTLYAFILAVIFSLLKLKLPETIALFAKNISQLYSVLGMMVIGLNMAYIKNYRIDFNFIMMAYLARYVVWPIATAIIIFMDDYIFHLYDHPTHTIWMVIAFIPMGVNVMTVATILKNKPEKVVTAILISTIMALFYVPLVITIFK